MEEVGRRHKVVTFEVGPKGRSVLPAEVRRAAGISDRDKMAAYCDGPGRIVLETLDAIEARVWASCGRGIDADMASTVELRKQEVAIEDDSFSRQSMPTDATTSRSAADHLLRTLGL